MGPWIKRKLGVMPLEKRLMLDASLPALAGQVLWLDAADATTIHDADGDNAATGTGGSNDGFSGSVATWADKSGSGYNVSAPVAGERPLYGVDTLNGHNTITLDGVNDRLINAGATLNGDDFSAFIIFRKTSAAGREATFELGNGASRNALFINNSGTIKYDYYLNSGFYSSTASYTTGSYSLASIVHDSTLLNLYVNGTSEVSAITTARASTTGIYIGDDSTSNDWLQGNIAEVIIYDRELGVEERHDVETYLASKWGLSITNAAPIIGINTGTNVNQGASVGIAPGLFAAQDSDNTDSLLIYTITDAVDHGTLVNTNTGMTLGLGSTFTQSDINSGYILYTHDNSLTSSDSFSATASDQLASSSAATFNISVIPSNTAPVISGWTLVSSENFEGGATGWSDNTTENGGSILTRFLGRHSLEGGAQNTYKTYALSGTQDYVAIDFDMYKLDSWDGENFRIYINDVAVYNMSFNAGTFQSPVDGSSGSVSWRVQETTPFLANFVYGSWNEQTFHYSLIVHSSLSNIKIGFSSTLDQVTSDESWGVDNLVINEVKGGGTPGPFKVSELSGNGEVIGTVFARDINVGQTLTYSITGGTGASVFAIDPSTGVLTVLNAAALNYEATPSYTLTVQVVDNGTPVLSDTETFTITVLDAPENTAPVVNALGPLTLAENATVGTALGTVTSSDAESNTVTYSITAGNVDNIFTINAATGSITVANTAALNYEWRNTYTLTIRGTDNGFGALSSTRNVTINITNVNEAPTFVLSQEFTQNNPGTYYNAATGNFYRYVSATVTQAAAATAAAGQTLNGVGGHLVTITSAAENTYVRNLISAISWLGGTDATVEGEWRWTAGPESGQMFWLGGIGGSVQGGLYANWASGQPDNSGNEDGLTMQVAGTWNDAPVGSSLAYVIEWEGSSVLAGLSNGPYTMAENEPLNYVVGSAHGSDPDVSDTLTYSITGGTGASHFAINSSTGQITLTNPSAANYELATSYTLDVRLQDASGLFATTTVTINISDVNEMPVLNTNTGTTLNEGASVVVTNVMLSSSDVDAPPDSALIYTISDATDNGTLTNTNTGLTLGLGGTFTQGDVDNGYILYTHNGSETLADAFTFNVTDGGLTTPAATFNFTINPVNDAPVIDGWTLVSSENFQSGATGWANNTTSTSNPYLTQYLGGFTQDGNVQTNYKTYSLSGTENYVVITLDFYEIDTWDAEFFKIYVDDTLVINHNFQNTTYDTPAGGSSGAVSWRVQNLTPFITNLGVGTSQDQIFRYTLTINTQSNAVKLGFGSNLDEALANESWGVDNISVYEVRTGGVPGPMQIAENSANGTVVGRVTSTDGEPAQTRTYSIIGGTGASVFAINGTTGTITVSNSAALNYESVSSYTLTVQVVDNGTPVLSDTETFTINVIDLPENTAPTFTASGPFTVNENVPLNTVVGSVPATDAEGNAITYSIVSGNTGSVFGINASGQIIVSNPSNLNYEALNSYSLVVRATDNGFGALSSQTTVNIAVNNLNEAPTFIPYQSVLLSNPGIVYNSTTGNFYRLVTGSTTYAAATTAAAGMLINGVGGHIATITSAVENAFLTSMITTSTWIGATDLAVEGEWRWDTGPEAGQLFWLGAAAGSAQNGLYSNWNGGEPNNSANEDGVQLLTSGRWNDINIGTSLPYLVEWEGAAVMASLQNGPYTISENSPINTTVGTLNSYDPDVGDVVSYSIIGGTGAGSFSVDSVTGAIRLTSAAAANHELASSYTLNVRVQDVGGLYEDMVLTINISDVNETPVLDLNTGATLNEGASMVVSNTMLSSSDVDFQPDSALIYTLSDSVDHGALRNSNTGLILSAGDTFTQGDIDNGYILYTHDDTENFSDSFSFTVTDGLITLPVSTFNLNVTPVNEVPVFIATGPYTIVENVPLNSSIGFATMTDPDLGDVITFSITGGTDMGSFAINALTGEITLSNAAAANYELSTSYTLDLRIQDSGGLFDTVTVTINITDANDAPSVLNISGQEVTENDPFDTVVGSLTTFDEDIGDSHTYSLISNPGGKFYIVGNELRVFANIDYEATQTITVVIRTDDAHGGLFDRSFTIQVHDLADTFVPPPTSGNPGGVIPSNPAGSSELSPWRESLVRASLFDGEAGQQSAFYGLGEFVQILRENTTFELRKFSNAIRDGIIDIFGTHEDEHRLEDEVVIEGLANHGISQVERYTNLREALNFLNQVAETEQSKDVPDEDLDGKAPDAQDRPEYNPLEQQFVDVMTYHEQREARLRQALLG